ncbi:MAG TPA: hypothetical protein VGI87_02450 [Solirubrobacteraceae bacterium]
MPANQLLAYRFDSSFPFDGQLASALERIESGGAMRVLDAVFVGRQADSGELVAITLSPTGAGGMVSALIDFRLDERRRRTATERALQSEAGDAISGLGEKLAPGQAIAAVLVEHTWAQILGDAVDRIGGSAAANEFVDVGRFDHATVARWLGSRS